MKCPRYAYLDAEVAAILVKGTVTESGETVSAPLVSVVLG